MKSPAAFFGDDMPKKTDLDIIRRMHAVKKLSLQGIRLVESHSKVGALRTGSLPTIGTQTANLELQSDTENKKTQAFVTLKLALNYEESERHDQNAPIQMGAKFLLQYTFEKTARQKQLLQEVLQSVAMMNIWPYWREFVQSTSVRMGLPPLTIPLYHIAQLENLAPHGEQKTR